MKVPKGLYEQLITREISEAVATLNVNATRVEQAPFDPVDSYEILARHVYGVCIAFVSRDVSGVYCPLPLRRTKRNF
jgi:hypothetical protein